jgi:hypothetical protein
LARFDRRAIPFEKKRMVTDNLAELAEIGKRMPAGGWEAKKRRLDGLYVDFPRTTSPGPNPYSIGVDTGVMRRRQGLKFYTTVDWDYRVHGEASGELPPLRQ